MLTDNSHKAQVQPFICNGICCGQMNLYEQMSIVVQDAFIMIDGEGDVKIWNKTAEIVFGFSKEEAVGRKLYELIIPERYQRKHIMGMISYMETGQGILAGEIVEIEALNKDREEFPIELSVSSVNIEGRRYTIGIIRDISKRKAREHNLLQQSIDSSISLFENKAQEKAEQLRKDEVKVLEMDRMAGLTTLSAGLAHEINNPLSIVKASVNFFSKTLGVFEHFIRYTMNMAASASPAEFIDAYMSLLDEFKIGDSISVMHRKINMSIRNIERIKEIVDSLKVFSRRDTADVDEVDINKCIDETLAITATGSVNVTREFSELPLYLCEPRSINQCFYQIISNAISAVKPDGNIHISTSQVSNDNGEMIVVKINDDGVGMSEEVLKKAFIPFFTTREVGAGKGLGLSIAEGILTRHSGTINIESEAGKGTNVTVYLPVVQNTVFH
ncbi:two-component system sensor histidine kinase NtrB [Candidatus Magnetominusculus xianensis]|nr:ATP-binding protein [Candidatus Magnetominusculus xianensis]